MAVDITNTTVRIIEEDWIDLCEDGSLLDQTAVRFSFIFIYLFVFIVCLLGNVFTIVVIALHPTMRTGTNYFLANLALADLLVAVFCILQNMVHIVGFYHGNWTLGTVLSALRRTNVLYLHLHVTFHTVFKRRYISMRIDGEVFRLRIWVTISFVLWYVVPLALLALMYTNIGIMLWRSGSCVITVTRPSNDSQCNAPSGLSSQMSNGKTTICRQESLLQVTDDLGAKRRQRDLTETRRKVQYSSPLHNYDRATPAWVRCRVVPSPPSHVHLQSCI
ncbi:unnamed protein product [Angiostrongylus costaricensis]|uniref:Thyrotropin-releasing hormone receptor n=1 Tax=Angiostrongylus costaricensis TaxID=334426 RepID=A0A158PM69_ANGCS|nr:unnamed protein product [Angiostrongylus costaricensis]